MWCGKLHSAYVERELLVIIPSSPCVHVVTVKLCMLVDR